ncbi:MAG TPA: hypothetical protein EYP05_04290 [Piscirickettsiaceae bacterium]|nr:hypothetical protein [Piscirickettsiaceae bacterium]
MAIAAKLDYFKGELDESLAEAVRRKYGGADPGLREGKGFSIPEIKEVGLGVAEAPTAPPRLPSVP